MRKPIEDKTPLAAWATLSRDEAGMSVEEVVDALAERGHSVRAATIRGIEGGSKGASVRLRRLLADVYGVKPPGQTETGPAQQGEAGIMAAAITAAINEQTEVFRELLGELRAFRIQQVEFLRTVAEHAARGPGADTAPSGDPVPVPLGRAGLPVQTR